MKRLFALAGAAFAALVMLVVTASPAFAHATLDSTSPSAGGREPTSPPAVVLQFSEPVSFESNSVRVFDSKGNTVDTGKIAHAGRSSAVRVPLPKLDDGVYAVTWRVTSADTHPVQGAFSFAVGNAFVNPQSNDFAQQLLSKVSSRDVVVSAGYGVVRFLVFSALALVAGMTAFVLALWPEGFTSTRVRRTIWVSWVVALVATALMIPFQAAYASGGGVSKLFDTSTVSDTLDTRAGKVWIARIVLLVLAMLLLRALARYRGDGPRPRPLLAAATVVGIAILATPALSGHASTGRWVWFAVPLDVVHVIAMSLWFGGLAVLGLEALRTTDVDSVEPMMERFSRLAMYAVAVLIVTGTFQTLRQVPHFGDLLHTNYGRILLIKLGAFVAVLVVAAGSRDIVRFEIRRGGRALLADSEPLPVGPGAKLAAPELPDPADTMHRLRSAVWYEIVFAVMVLIVTSLLVNAAPATAASASKPYFATLRSEDNSTWVEVEVTPTKVGPTQVHATVEKPTGVVMPVLDLKLTLAEPAKGVAPIDVKLIRIGVGHYQSVGATFPFAGTWQIEAKALVNQTTEEAVIGAFKVSN